MIYENRSVCDGETWTGEHEGRAGERYQEEEDFLGEKCHNIKIKCQMSTIN